MSLYLILPLMSAPMCGSKPKSVSNFIPDSIFLLLSISDVSSVALWMQFSEAESFFFRLWCSFGGLCSHTSSPSLHCLALREKVKEREVRGAQILVCCLFFFTCSQSCCLTSVFPGLRESHRFLSPSSCSQPLVQHLESDIFLWVEWFALRAALLRALC